MHKGLQKILGYPKHCRKHYRNRGGPGLLIGVILAKTLDETGDGPLRRLCARLGRLDLVFLDVRFPAEEELTTIFELCPPQVPLPLAFLHPFLFGRKPEGIWSSYFCAALGAEEILGYT